METPAKQNVIYIVPGVDDTQYHGPAWGKGTCLVTGFNFRHGLLAYRVRRGIRSEEAGHLAAIYR